MRTNDEIIDLIKSICIEKDISLSELARRTDMAKSAISRYFNKSRQFPLNRVNTFAKALNTTPEYLLDVSPVDKSASIELMSIYNELCPPRQEKVMIYAKEQLEDQSGKFLREEETTPYKPIIPLCQYPYVVGGASAGSTSFMMDANIETLQAPVKEGADFIISVSGDSMEPDFYDGDRVYVKKTTELQEGEIGIFLVSGSEIYIKELGPNGLISHNSKYSTIKSPDVVLIGKVLGKVE